MQQAHGYAALRQHDQHHHQADAGVDPGHGVAPAERGPPEARLHAQQGQQRQRKALVRAQQAALEQARVAYEATVLTALKDVEDALVALQGDRERLKRLLAAAEAAANAALLAQQRYASGLIDFATVLETQRTQLSAQDSVAATVASVAADHVRLYKALGGGWQ